MLTPINHVENGKYYDSCRTLLWLPTAFESLNYIQPFSQMVEPTLIFFFKFQLKQSSKLFYFKRIILYNLIQEEIKSFYQPRKA